MSTALALSKKDIWLRDKQGAYAHLRPKALAITGITSTVFWAEAAGMAYIEYMQADQQLQDVEFELDELKDRARKYFYERAHIAPEDELTESCDSFLENHDWDVLAAVRNFNAKQLGSSNMQLSSASALGGDSTGDAAELSAAVREYLADRDELQRKKNDAEAKLRVAREHTLTPDNYVILFSKAIATTSTRRVLEIAAMRQYGEHVLSKLVKHVPRSAQRKQARGSGRLLLCGKIYATALRGEVLTCLSVALIEQLHFTIVFALEQGKAKTARAKREGQKAVAVGAARQYAHRTMMIFLRAAAVLVLNATGASLGTLVWPGKGTMVGQLVLPLGADKLLQGLLALTG
eukprot:g1187.t1